MLLTREGPSLEESDAKAGVLKWLLNDGGKIRPNRRPKKRDLGLHVEVELDSYKGVDEIADQESQIMGDAGNGDDFE